MKPIKITERGWAGHFCAASRCSFRRNTLLQFGSVQIVVSSVGLYRYKEEIETIGAGRYYETMAFHADKNDKRYHDADVSKQISFRSKWAIADKDADDKANLMHDNVVKEISKRMINGEDFKEISNY